MACDQLQSVQRLAKDLRSPSRDIFVGCAMETVFPDTIPLIYFIWQCVKVCIFGHGLVKCRIEYADHGFFGHEVHRCFYACYISGIMERSKLDAIFKGLHYFLVYYHRAGKLFAAMHDPVSYSAYLIHTGNYSGFIIGKHIRHLVHCHGMVYHVLLDYRLLASDLRMFDNGIVNPYPVAHAFCQNRFLLHINQLIFERRTARINY